MKKIISLILCAVLVLGMAVSAFAATDNSVNPLPNNPTRPAPVEPSEPDIIVVDITEDVNPNTGAPVFGIVALLGCAAAFAGKRK